MINARLGMNMNMFFSKFCEVRLLYVQSSDFSGGFVELELSKFLSSEFLGLQFAQRQIDM